MRKVTTYYPAIVIFAALYFSGHWFGYRIGFQHGYAATDELAASEEVVQRAYDVDDLVSDGPDGGKDFQRLIVTCPRFLYHGL